MANDQHPKVGELRPSQLMHTFGIGAIVDLPNLSVMVMGLDDWKVDSNTMAVIAEDRLLAAVRWELGDQVERLLAPPIAPNSEGVPQPFDPMACVGVPVAPFPRWMLCPECRLLARLDSGLFELRPHYYHPDGTKYVHINCNKAKNPPTVIPARFMVACRDGHLDDFPWKEYVHGGPTDCDGQLRLIEYGPSGEARDLEVRCSCGETRRLADAFGQRGEYSLPPCRGRWPHLRRVAPGGCEEQRPSKAILLGASNLWFPVTISTVAIPASSDRLDQLVESNWNILMNANTVEVLQAFWNAQVLTDFIGFTIDQVWGAVERKRERDETGESLGGAMDLKTPEWEMLTHPTEAPQTDDFQLRPVASPPLVAGWLSQVVLVEKLREVSAMVGFTRIDSPGELGEPSQIDKDRVAPISRRDPTWVPASEVRGEGIFMQFDEAKIQAWLDRRAVDKWNNAFFSSHTHWRKAHEIENPEANYPTLRYVLLHSFSHALMRQLALECGYTTASIRERIYSRSHLDDQGPMAGVLLYTAAPDSEGTLGGLVSLGEPARLDHHIREALWSARLCSSDPLCAEHNPSLDGRTIHAAACHACMFVPETSCERGNKYLDRSVLVPTVERDDLAFFGGD